MSWTNEDGLLVRYGLELGTAVKDGTILEEIETLRIPIDSQAPIALADVNADRPHLPAYAYIVDAWIVADTAWTGTSPALSIGLATGAGVAISATGIFSAYDTTTNLAARGDVGQANGAYANGTQDIGTVDAWVYVPTVTNITAGTGTLYLRYIPRAATN